MSSELTYYAPICGFFLVCALMTVGWLIQVIRKDASIVDVFWTVSVGALGVLYAAMGTAPFERRIYLALIVSAWSLRLALYILFDRVIGKEEDGRYRYLREHWAGRVNFKFFAFFQAQGLAAIFFSIPFFFISTNASPIISTFEFIGIALFIVSLVGEWFADKQLKEFREQPSNKGKTCQVGLWRYSRHPNYFFEWLHWCSYVLMLVGATGVYLSILCPLVMLFSLFKVTGIPHTEAQALRSRGDEYRKYQKTTSVFIPWFPKSR